VKATRLGALDFVEKPIGLERLLLTLRNALRLDRLQRENKELQKYWRDELALIGESRQMAALRAVVERAAPADVPILILGENGTGKELVARAVHDLSPRREQPFVKMNCAAVPAELVESELFGHEKGAFSGAVAQRRGRFEQADGGTLFLDEIGDMAGPMQAKLLRVLQDGEIARVGGTGEIKVDVRVISATNRDLDALVAEGRFREDLYYRINTLSLRTPALARASAGHPVFGRALRRRRRAAPSLAAPPALTEALALLQEQPWKGNVRELRNVVERVLILSDADPIGPSDVRAALPGAGSGGPAARPP
jgi:DNA-binding NtrC family response regulator